MKRFWDTASAQKGPEGYTILLDGKPMHVPGGRQLVVFSEALAPFAPLPFVERQGDRFVLIDEETAEDKRQPAGIVPLRMEDLGPGAIGQGRGARSRVEERLRDRAHRLVAL